MSVTATSQGAKAAHGLRTHISVSSTFQTACGVATAAAAVPFIKLVADYPEADNLYTRPLALIFFPKLVHRIQRDAAVIMIEFDLYKDVPDEYRPSPEGEEDAFTDFYNFADGVLGDIIDTLNPIYAATGGATLIGSQVEWVTEMQRTKVSDTNEDFISARFNAHVGRSQ